MGSIYWRGEIAWIKYYRNGKPYRESTKTSDPDSRGGTSKTYANNLLKKREGEITSGHFHGLNVEKILVDELATDYLTDFQINNKKSLDHAERYAKYLAGVVINRETGEIERKKYPSFFGGMKAVNVSSSLIEEYIKKRQAEGMTNATINRELSALKRMFSLGAEKTPRKVINPPHVQHLEENNVRHGFFEHPEYLKMMGALPEYLRLPFTIAYSFGLRKEEVFSLLLTQVNLIDGKITLDDTKNGESRIAPIKAEVYEEVANQIQTTGKQYPNCIYLCHREGNRIIDFRSAWETSLRKIGIKPAFKCKCGKVTELPEGMEPENLKCHACGSENLKKHDRLWHDLRRTAVRNMVRAGVNEKIAMRISGHKTRSIFDRYNIVNEQDLENAAESITAFHRQASEKVERINLQIGTDTRQGVEQAHSRHNA